MSAISLIALIGISLGVAAMIVTFAVREGFRVEYIRTIIGNQAHATLIPVDKIELDGALIAGIPNYDDYAKRVEGVEGVESATPLVVRQLMITAGQIDNFTEVYGVEVDAFRGNSQLVDNNRSYGEIDAFQEGEWVIALGQGLAWQLGVDIGDKVVLTSAQGVDTAIGSTPRQAAYDVVYIVDSGNDFVDRARVYLPLGKAQEFFNLEGVATQIDIRVDDAENISNYSQAIESKLDGRAFVSDWKRRNAGVLNGLKTEDNIMFILMSVLVIVSSFTIAAGLIMLVKNKTSDIAILRTMGFSQGRVMRIFFLAGVTLSILGTVAGVILGALFCVFFDQIFLFVSWIIGGAENAWALQVVAQLDAVWNWSTVLKTCALSLVISIIITILPARAAAKLDPAEALRHG